MIDVKSSWVCIDGHVWSVNSRRQEPPKKRGPVSRADRERAEAKRILAERAAQRQR